MSQGLGLPCKGSSWPLLWAKSPGVRAGWFRIGMSLPEGSQQQSRFFQRHLYHLSSLPWKPGEGRIRVLRNWLGGVSTNPFCRELESNSNAAVGMGAERRGYESELNRNIAKLSRRKRLKPYQARQSFGRV